MANDKKCKDDGDDQAWMGTYADLVTLLLCFFVLLFAMSNIDVEKFEALLSSFDNNIDLLPGGKTLENGNLISNGIVQIDNLETYKKSTVENGEEEKMKENQEIAEGLIKELEKEGLLDKIEITYNAQFVSLSLNGAVLFNSAEAHIKKESLTLMNHLSEALKKYQNYNISIEGHTDNRPINTYKYPSNMYLSSSRAISVYEFLVNNKDFNEEQLYAVGYGEYRPIASNNTEEGRAKNRRVEIKIVNSVS